MKKITIVSVLALSAMVLVSSCKKEKNPDQTPAQPKLVKMELTGGGTATITYSYNAEGRLIERKHNIYTNQYDYSSPVFLQNTFDNSTAKKTYEISSTAVSAGKVTAADYKSFNPNGSLNYNQPHTFQYNAEGNLINRSYGFYNYANEFSAGNLVRSYGTKLGSSFSEYTYEYYTDKQDKFNINWMESTYQEQFLNDKALFGTRNKNLLKKVTNAYTGGNTYVYDFVYTFDQNGSVSTCTSTESTNGVTSAVYNYKFFYQ